MPGPINAALLQSGDKLQPDKRTVVFRRRTATTPTYTDYTLTLAAWYRPDGTEEGGPSQGVYLKRYRRWLFKKNVLAATGFTADPDPGDLIVNTATALDPVAGSWTVLRQSEAGALGAWELSCVLLEVRSALAVSVVVQRRTGVKDDTARMLPTTSVAATVSGWLQADDSEANGDLLGKLQMPTEGIVYLATTTTLLATDTLLISGVSYNIKNQSNPNHLEELQSVQVQLAR